MKFISKSSNLLIVLKAGLPAQPITGTPAQSTISVRFKDGMAELHDEALVKMMLAHPGFNGDFISADDVPVDPYAASRQPSEPAHTLVDMKYGTPSSRTVGGGAMSQLPPELKKLVTEASIEMAKGMLPGMVESTLRALVQDHAAEKKADTQPKKKAGRPSSKKTQTTVESTAIKAENPAIKE